MKFHEGLLKDNYLHVDETPIRVMKEKGKKDTVKSYMWVYTTGSYSDKQTCGNLFIYLRWYY